MGYSESATSEPAAKESTSDAPNGIEDWWSDIADEEEPEPEPEPEPLLLPLEAEGRGAPV